MNLILSFHAIKLWKTSPTFFSSIVLWKVSALVYPEDPAKDPLRCYVAIQVFQQIKMLFSVQNFHFWKGSTTSLHTI